jgi:hypothetical protein
VRHPGGRRRSTHPKRLFIDSDEAEISCGETGTVTPIADRACRVSEAVTIEYAAVVNSSRRRLPTSGAKVTRSFRLVWRGVALSTWVAIATLLIAK